MSETELQHKGQAMTEPKTTTSELTWGQKFLCLFLMYLFILSCSVLPLAMAVFMRNIWWISGYFISLPLWWSTESMIESSQEDDTCKK